MGPDRFALLPGARGGLVGDVQDDVRGSFGRGRLYVRRVPGVVARGVELYFGGSDGRFVFGPSAKVTWTSRIRRLDSCPNSSGTGPDRSLWERNRSERSGP